MYERILFIYLFIFNHLEQKKFLIYFKIVTEKLEPMKKNF